MPDDPSRLLDGLPHRAPMRLIDEVVSISSGEVTCRSTIGDDHILRRDVDGRVPALVTVELLAQSAAALMMHRASLTRAGGGMTRGVLVGARTLDFAVDAFEVGDVLTTRLWERYTADSIVQLSGEVTRDDVVVATGAINVARR